MLGENAGVMPRVESARFRHKTGHLGNQGELQHLGWMTKIVTVTALLDCQEVTAVGPTA
jgi:hypothetical protein